MKNNPHPLRVHLFWIALLLLALPMHLLAADDTSAEEKFGRMQGVPASVSIGGGGMLPQGHAITAWNASYRSKYEGVEGENQKNNRNIDNTTFVNMLKLRYGVTDNIEVQAVVPYTFYDPMAGHNLDSWGDIVVAGMYGFLQEKSGDPVSLALSLKAGLPTGSTGPSALPGGDVWSGTAALGLTKTWGLNQVAFDLWATQPFEEGNSHVRKGDSYGFNYKYARSLTQNLDVGIEGIIEHANRGERYGVEMKNDYTEWYTGPAVTYNIPGTTIDLAVGAYLPVYRSYGQNTSSDSVRVDGKFFIFW
ncbi:MAG: hypothetical protein AUJ49_10390 [Desulfovibrionaceae bacterium CG1_02_65_16]|nr:MAG: hypothetical protein AUJ49_10390 [Desulfovibrionaceae bacterium CG1_02_65_16]